MLKFLFHSFFRITEQHLNDISLSYRNQKKIPEYFVSAARPCWEKQYHQVWHVQTKLDMTASANEHWRLKALEKNSLTEKCRADTCVFVLFSSGIDEIAFTVRP